MCESALNDVHEEFVSPLSSAQSLLLAVVQGR